MNIMQSKVTETKTRVVTTQHPGTRSLNTTVPSATHEQPVGIQKNNGEALAN